ncbi:glutamate ABC transporter substrate-binding protein [Streptomyces sp. ACA25]|uniref:glutamate ABC transporter substrate-binding protein n=1 Tax=Streptomyces sp. ACA25 TaxID=3022596 RepID=UPI002FE0C760
MRTTRTAEHGRSRPRGRNRLAWALAAAGTTLAAVMLAGALPQDGEARPAVRGGADPATTVSDHRPGDRVRHLAEREVCADGRDPAESLAPSPDTGVAVRRIQERGELVVGVDQNSYLWGYRTPDTGKIVGFDIDLTRAIATELLGPDPRIVLRAVPTSERVRLIQDREVDMVVRTMSITCDRWQEVAFSTAYFEAGQQVLAPRHSDITGFDGSLDGARVCSAEGSAAEDLLEAEGRALGAELLHVGNHLDCLVLIQLGQADALITDSALAAGHAAQDPGMHLIGDPLTLEPYGVAMHLDDTDLVRRVNRALEDFRGGGADSGWQQAYGSWLAAHMDHANGSAPAPPDPLYRD